MPFLPDPESDGPTEGPLVTNVAVASGSGCAEALALFHHKVEPSNAKTTNAVTIQLIIVKRSILPLVREEAAASFCAAAFTLLSVRLIFELSEAKKESIFSWRFFIDKVRHCEEGVLPDEAISQCKLRLLRLLRSLAMT